MSNYERWQERFADPGYLFGTEPNAFLQSEAARLPEGGKVLVVADGEGRNGVWLQQQGFAVTSQDFSPIAQDKARTLAVNRGVEPAFELSDLTARDWEAGVWDGIVGIFFQPLGGAARAAVFEAFGRALKPGGVLLIEGYGLQQPGYGTGGPPDPALLYTPELLREAFGGFAELEVRERHAEISEGAGHCGMSHLIDLVARR